MSIAYITEFRYLENSNDIGGVPQAAKLPGVTQTVTFTASTQSTVMDYNTRMVRIHVDAACHVAVGDNPTATTSAMKMAADSTEYFGIAPGQKLAFVNAN